MNIINSKLTRLRCVISTTILIGQSLLLMPFDINGGVHAQAYLDKQKNTHNLYRMSSKDINNRIVGHSFTPQEFGNPPHIRFLEFFGYDGKWVSIRYERGPATKEGRWEIDNDKICVVIPVKPRICRNVYIDISNKLPAFSDIKNDTVLIMNQNISD